MQTQTKYNPSQKEKKTQKTQTTPPKKPPKQTNKKINKKPPQTHRSLPNNNFIHDSFLIPHIT